RYAHAGTASYLISHGHLFIFALAFLQCRYWRALHPGVFGVVAGHQNRHLALDPKTVCGRGLPEIAASAGGQRLNTAVRGRWLQPNYICLWNARRVQLDFGDGLIADVSDLREDLPIRSWQMNKSWRRYTTPWRSGIPRAAAAVGWEHRPKWCCGC